MITHGQAADPYWSVVKNGVDAAAKTQGADVDYRSPDTFDMVQMAQLVDAAVASKPDGLVVSIPDADALGPSVRRATEGGIPVIVIDSGGAKLTRELGGLLYLGQSEYEAGVAAGERAAKLGIKKAACLNQEVGNTSLDDRCAGFAKGLGAEVPVVAGTMDPTEMKGRTARLSARQSRHRLPVRAVGSWRRSRRWPRLEELELGGKVKIGTFDLSPGVLQAVVDGKMEWGIDAQQYLMGYMPVVFLTQNAKYGVTPIGTVETGPLFITQENAEQVIELSAKGIR